VSALAATTSHVLLPADAPAAALPADAPEAALPADVTFAFEDYEVFAIKRKDQGFRLEGLERPVVTEVSLRILVNGVEVASLICLGQQQVELALGFLYSEGVIESSADVLDARYHAGTVAALITLREGLSVRREQVLRSVTAGCGKCFTYINPLRKNQFAPVSSVVPVALDEIMVQMQDFVQHSELYRMLGGVHSVLLSCEGFSIFAEDLGRHNCLDKAAGTLLRDGQLSCAKRSICYISGRVTSEIIGKAIRLGVPVIVSKSTPSATAVQMAQEYGVTLLGYVKSESGFVYSGVERLR
jgi:FdhD protein